MFALIIAKRGEQISTTTIYQSIYCARIFLAKIARRIKQASLLSMVYRDYSDVGGNATFFVYDLNGQTDFFFCFSCFDRLFFLFLHTVYKLFVVQTIFLDFNIVHRRIRTWKHEITSLLQNWCEWIFVCVFFFLQSV